MPTRPATTASTARKNAGFGFPAPLAMICSYLGFLGLLLGLLLLDDGIVLRGTEILGRGHDRRGLGRSHAELDLEILEGVVGHRFFHLFLGLDLVDAFARQIARHTRLAAVSVDLALDDVLELTE